MQDCIAVGISLPRNIISKIDSDRGDISRSKYLLRILEKTYLIGEGKKEYHFIRSNNQDSLESRFESLHPSEPRST